MLNTSFTQTTKVTELQTAAYLGSGTLPVLATPALIAFMENTAMKILTDFSVDETSVGISINMKHLKASAIGSTIQCNATIIEINGRKFTFEIKAYENENLIGEALHERVIVNVEKFLTKMK